LFDESSVERRSSSTSSGNDDVFTIMITKLKLLFIEMEYSILKSVNPSDLIGEFLETPVALNYVTVIYI
jgi:hypothetical protein